jgi:8-oxo-dGTP pyrophosphatase MutT (NUDIX family)
VSDTAARAPFALLSPSGRRLAAVLVPVYDSAEGPTLLLIRRTTTINHPGQVAFPGGRPEPGDADLLATALREAHEELGIDPSTVQIVGALPVVETMTSNYAISPFVGRLSERPALRIQESEVAAVLDVPVAALLRDGLPIEEEWLLPLPGERAPATSNGPVGALQTRRVRFYPWGEDKIWGATGRILENLVAALTDGSIRL